MFQTEERHWCLIGASNQPNIFIPNFDVSLLPGSELGPKRRSARASRVLETSWSNKQNAKSAHQLFWSHKSHCFGWHCLLLQWSLHMSITGTPSASKFFSSHSLRLSNRADLDTSTRKAIYQEFWEISSPIKGSWYPTQLTPRRAPYDQTSRICVFHISSKRARGCTGTSTTMAPGIATYDASVVRSNQPQICVSHLHSLSPFSTLLRNECV